MKASYGECQEMSLEEYEKTKEKFNYGKLGCLQVKKLRLLVQDLLFGAKRLFETLLSNNLPNIRKSFRNPKPFYN